MRIFERDFSNLDNSFIQDLRTLESEGAIYSQFWQDEFCDFRFCRIRLTPPEIVDYVEASEAFNEFSKYLELSNTSKEALNKISNNKIRNRVLKYNIWAESIEQDTLYCFAAFVGKHIEDLLCGGIQERYEFLNQSYTGDRRFLLLEILEMFSSCSDYIGLREANLHNYLLEREKDVRDLLYILIKGVFSDAKVEEPTQIHAGGSKRIDIVIPKISTLIEIKFVRDSQHAKKIADELKIDIESYHNHSNCKTLHLFVWDKNRLIKDRENFIKDLRGFRKKDTSEFNVEVLVKP